MSLKVGIQLYSVRNSMQENPVQTIKKVVELGYKNIEVANHNANEDSGVGFGIGSDDMNKLMNDLSAKVINAHIFPFEEKNAPGIVKYHKSIGNHKITCAIDFFKNKEEVLEKCQYYNRMGQLCKDEGMMFLYHNHFEEFQEFDGERVFDIIANNTNPELVFFEVDSYWVYRGGADPIELFKQYGDRIKLIHQKDFPKDIEDPINVYEIIDKNACIDLSLLEKLAKPETFVEIGHGILNIQGIINAAIQYTDATYIILEQDRTALGELESIKKSMEAFKKFDGIQW